MAFAVSLYARSIYKNRALKNIVKKSKPFPSRSKYIYVSLKNFRLPQKDFRLPQFFSVRFKNGVFFPIFAAIFKL